MINHGNIEATTGMQHTFATMDVSKTMISKSRSCRGIVGPLGRRALSPRSYDCVRLVRFLFVLACAFSVSMMVSMPMVVAGVRLTPAATVIEQAFPSNAAQTNISPRGLASLNAIKGQIITVARDLLIGAAAAYKAEFPYFDMQFGYGTTNGLVKGAFNAGGWDFAVATAAPVQSDYLAKPALGYYPLQSNGIVSAYNLPGSFTNGGVLSLTGLSWCRIYRGNITQWDDPDIIATNPGFNYASLTATTRKLRVLVLSTGSATHLAFSTYCNKIDPAYTQAGTMIKPNVLPIYPTASYAAVAFYPDVDLMGSALSDLPFSFCMNTLSNARTINLAIGAFVNREGRTIVPNTNSMSLNLFELATNGYAAGTNSYDLTNPSTAQAWPILTMSYIFVDKSSAITTCASKRQMTEFFLWFYTSPVVASIGDSLSMVVFSSVFVSQLRLLENLRAELQCLDSPLSSANQEVGHISVHQLAAKVMTLYSNFYSAVDSTRTYRISTLSESLAVQRVAAGELSLALLNPAVLSSNDISILGTASAVLTPAFMVGVVPIFTLPAALTTWAFASVNKATVLTMPALYPLKLDLETAAAIFIGQVTSWLDPRLVLLNPQLPDWFTASSASPALTLIVGATAVSDSRSSAKLLFQTLAASQLAQKPENAGFFNTDLWTVAGSNPFSAVLAAAPNTTVMIDVEPRTSIKVQTTPGSVSYRPVSQSGVIRAITDVATVVEFVFVRGPSDTNPVRANVASLKACSAPYTDYVAATTTTESVDGSVGADAEAVKETLTRMSLFATQQRWVDSANPADGCWPLATLLSFASSPEYSTSSSSSSSSSVNTDQCLVGMHALEFINYIQTTNILNGPAESFGVTRLAEAPTVKRLSQEQVYAATCNGEFMLVIQPSFYTVSDSVVAFGRAIGIIGLLVVLVSTVIVIQFRFRVIIRSASVPFLLVILAGIALLFGALIAWSVEPTKRSCDAFAWLVNLGLACIFVPLFAKTWRIFSGARLKVVKISNLKLLLFTAGVLLLEVLILSVWSGVSPLIPIEYTRELANTHYFTHCSVTSNGMPFVVIEAVFKAGLLLIGALLAFSTRNIKGSFSEASQIAWTIYQTVLASVILIGIIVFISAVESTLTILVQIYLMWLCFSTLGLLFIPKFYILLQDEQDTIEASRSELPQEKSGGFSFASVAIMEKAQLRQYYFALRLQIHKAEAVLGLVRTPFAELRGVLWPTAGSNKDGAGGGGANTSTGGGELHHRSRGANTSFSGANGGETQALSPTGENRSRDGIVSDKYWQEKEQFVLSAVQRPEKETKTGFGTSSSQVSLSGRQSPQSSKFSMPAGRRAISIGVPVGTVAPAPASTPNPIASPSHVGSAANANANGAQLATSNSFSSSSGPSTPVPAQDLTNTPNTASDLLKFDDPLPGTVPTVVSVHIPDSAPSSSLSPSEDTPAPIVTDAQATSPSFSPTADSRSLATASSTKPSSRVPTDVTRVASAKRNT